MQVDEEYGTPEQQVQLQRSIEKARWWPWRTINEYRTKLSDEEREFWLALLRARALKLVEMEEDEE